MPSDHDDGDGNRRAQADPNSDAHSDSDPDCDRDKDSDSDAYDLANPNILAHRNAIVHSCPEPNSDLAAAVDAHRHGHTHLHRDGNAPPF